MIGGKSGLVSEPTDNGKKMILHLPDQMCSVKLNLTFVCIKYITRTDVLDGRRAFKNLFSSENSIVPMQGVIINTIEKLNRCWWFLQHKKSVLQLNCYFLRTGTEILNL